MNGTMQCPIPNDCDLVASIFHAFAAESKGEARRVYIREMGVMGAREARSISGMTTSGGSCCFPGGKW